MIECGLYKHAATCIQYLHMHRYTVGTKYITDVLQYILKKCILHLRVWIMYVLPPFLVLSMAHTCMCEINSNNPGGHPCEKLVEKVF